MPFTTKLDFSNNRQVKQYPETLTVLSGATSFGLPFSALTIGPDLSTTGVTQTITTIVSTFSGNSGTTVFNWSNPNMSLAYSTLSAITTSNSGITQTTGQVYTANTTTIIDGNTIVLTYSGVSFDVQPLVVINLGGGAYSGSVQTNELLVLSAGTLDFTGRAIWVDVSGITRTENLIITDSPQIGYAWTCIDSEGRGEWAPSSAITSGYWSASTGVNAIVIINSNATASGDYSICEGYGTLATGNYSHAEGNQTRATGRAGHAEGSGTIASGSTSHTEGTNTIAGGVAAHAEGNTTNAMGSNSHAGGINSVASGATSFVHGNASVAGGTSTIVLGDNITGVTANTTYVENLNIKTVGAGPGTTDIGIDANGNVVNQASDLRLKENITTIEDALNKVLNLRGVTYNWKNREAGGDDLRYGFIAQEVNNIVPELTFISGSDKYMGVQYKDVTALLVEAVKTLVSGGSKTYLQTQTIVAEDNNIELNFDGNQISAVDGGIKVLHALGDGKPAELVLNSSGFWTTNNDLAPKALIIPIYTPTSTSDIKGNTGNITRDDEFLYVKGVDGWKRTKLESF